MSRGDDKELSEALDAGDAALVVVGRSKLDETLNRELKRADRRIEKQVKAHAERWRRICRPTPRPSVASAPPAPTLSLGAVRGRPASGLPGGPLDGVVLEARVLVDGRDARIADHRRHRRRSQNLGQTVSCEVDCRQGL
jgi:hypothetical protein